MGNAARRNHKGSGFTTTAGAGERPANIRKTIVDHMAANMLSGGELELDEASFDQLNEELSAAEKFQLAGDLRSHFVFYCVFEPPTVSKCVVVLNRALGKVRKSGLVVVGDSSDVPEQDEKPSAEEPSEPEKEH